jgi:hypothetical protein
MRPAFAKTGTAKSDTPELGYGQIRRSPTTRKQIRSLSGHYLPHITKLQVVQEGEDPVNVRFAVCGYKFSTMGSKMPLGKRPSAQEGQPKPKTKARPLRSNELRMSMSRAHLGGMR